MSGKDFDKAISVLEEMTRTRKSRTTRSSGPNLPSSRSWPKERTTRQGLPVAKKLAETKKDDPQILNELSWTILDTKDLKDRDLDVALEIAKLAGEASKYESGAISTRWPGPTLKRATSTRPSNIRRRPSKRVNDQEVSDENRTQIKETLEKYKAKKAEAK